MVVIKFSGGNSELRRLLDERMESLRRQWQENRAERDRIEQEAEGLMHDLGAIKDALEVEIRHLGEVIVEHSRDGTSQLLGLKLRDAIALLRREVPGISQKQMRQRLEQVQFDFKGKKPGNAINMASVSLDAQARRQSGKGK